VVFDALDFDFTAALEVVDHIIEELARVRVDRVAGDLAGHPVTLATELSLDRLAGSLEPVIPDDPALDHLAATLVKCSSRVLLQSFGPSRLHHAEHGLVGDRMDHAGPLPVLLCDRAGPVLEQRERGCGLEPAKNRVALERIDRQLM
jgi:hypothetical protein